MTLSPSISKNAIPTPDRSCKIKPSPPNKPAENFFVNATFKFTPGSAQRNAPFWHTIPPVSPTLIGMISPATVDAKAMVVPGACAVYLAINMDSPANILPTPFIIPPLVLVLISIPSDCQTIPPDCVYIDSPAWSNKISTAGIVFPTILYCINTSVSNAFSSFQVYSNIFSLYQQYILLLILPIPEVISKPHIAYYVSNK